VPNEEGGGGHVYCIRGSWGRVVVGARGSAGGCRLHSCCCRARPPCCRLDPSRPLHMAGGEGRGDGGNRRAQVGRGVPVRTYCPGGCRAGALRHVVTPGSCVACVG
jgi:hypothetical protein